MNIQATYEVPGGANPALLLDNPNFNKKICEFPVLEPIIIR